MNRRGVTLIELVATLPLLLAFSVVMAGLFPRLLRDTPKIQRVVHVHRGLGRMLRSIQADVDAAEELPEQFGKKTTGETILLIRLPGKVVAYEIGEDLIVRSELSHESGRAERQTGIWSLPNAKVRFRLWRGGGAGYAVEVRSAVEWTAGGYKVDKLSNTRVYFVGSLSGGREKT